LDFADDRSEWLETDGLGGFASGTPSGERTRRYHGLLLVATTPPTGRMMLVNGFDAWVITSNGRFALSSQRYTPHVVFPDGATRIEAFTPEPWPRWTFALADGTRIEQELVHVHHRPFAVVSWRLLTPSAEMRLEVRPFLSGRDYHSLHHENGSVRFESETLEDVVTWRPYEGVPSVSAVSNGQYTHAPEWYRNFLYTAEQERGLDCVEDLASPGTFTWDLSAGDAHLAVTTEPARDVSGADLDAIRAAERTRRAAFPTPLHCAADAYLVTRGSGATIIAGYPWFADWGRDTFIALPGLCLATSRLDAAGEILTTWAGAISEGMLPNRFSDSGEQPEFNAVDASLWFIIAVQAYVDEKTRSGTAVRKHERRTLDRAVLQIVEGYAAGTRHRIHVDDDGLLAAGEPGVQLTWMDARVGDRAVTPRVGKPVEIQCLWINALAIAGARDPRWLEAQQRATRSFADRFWNEARGCLYDVIDVDHVRGTADASLRPNQIFAAGGLPLALVTSEQARRIVDSVERELLVPAGLRTLAPSESGYIGRYGGGVGARDGAYHQGTAWPWLLYAFADACARTRPPDAAAKTLTTIVAALRRHLNASGLGHLPEVVDGDAPHAPGGCPFQAWSLAALLRLEAMASGGAKAPPYIQQNAVRGEPVEPRT
jgi:predicted glycogen debranching enzyme